ncbi:MAG: hypothetical protein WD552_02585 [Candidatus Paceibacterota bacterium]
MQSNPMYLPLFLIGCLLTSGCGAGAGGVTVTGQVVENGQPIEMSDYDEEVSGLRVIFVPLTETGESSGEVSQVTSANEDGTFTMAGNMGTGIEPGKYRIGLIRFKRDASGSEKDQWQGKYGPVESPFVQDISGSNSKLKIDLAEAQ